MTRRAHVIRHVAFEDLGTLHEELLKTGHQITYFEAGADDLKPLMNERAELLIVLGGPISAYEEEEEYPFIQTELELLRARLRDDEPTLGICLGAQLMARALGARVYPGGRKEIGWSPLQLTAAGNRGALRHLAETDVLHWHGDTFDLPAGSTHLAATSIYPAQAFTWKKRCLALQFHPEVEPRGLERWFIGHAGEIAATAGVTVRDLRQQTAQKGPALVKAAQALWRDWVADLY